MYDENVSNFLNCDKRIFDGVGQYDTPSIYPQDIDIEGATCIGFNYAKTEKEPSDKILHFFLDDYQFDRLWRNPDKYLELIQKFKAVLSPDFSLYSDFPKAVSMYNHYRKQWCGAYWQEHGIKVIPTVCWAEPNSYEFCFDGIPRNALVCISTVGMFANKEQIEKFLEGYHIALDTLKPNKILFYGKLYPEIDVPQGIEYAVAVNQNMQKLSQIRDSRKKKREKKA